MRAEQRPDAMSDGNATRRWKRVLPVLVVLALAGFGFYLSQEARQREAEQAFAVLARYGVPANPGAQVLYFEQARQGEDVYWVCLKGRSYIDLDGTTRLPPGDSMYDICFDILKDNCGIPAASGGELLYFRGTMNGADVKVIQYKSDGWVFAVCDVISHNS